MEFIVLNSFAVQDTCEKPAGINERSLNSPGTNC